MSIALQNQELFTVDAKSETWLSAKDPVFLEVCRRFCLLEPSVVVGLPESTKARLAKLGSVSLPDFVAKLYDEDCVTIRGAVLSALAQVNACALVELGFAVTPLGIGPDGHATGRGAAEGKVGLTILPRQRFDLPDAPLPGWQFAIGVGIRPALSESRLAIIEQVSEMGIGAPAPTSNWPLVGSRTLYFRSEGGEPAITRSPDGGMTVYQGGLVPGPGSFLRFGSEWAFLPIPELLPASELPVLPGVVVAEFQPYEPPKVPVTWKELVDALSEKTSETFGSELDQLFAMLAGLSVLERNEALAAIVEKTGIPKKTIHEWFKRVHASTLEAAQQPKFEPLDFGGKLLGVRAICSPARCGVIAKELIAVNRDRLKTSGGAPWLWTGTHWSVDSAETAIEATICETVLASTQPPSDAHPNGQAYPTGSRARGDIGSFLRSTLAAQLDTELWEGEVSTGWDIADVISTPKGYFNVRSREYMSHESSLFCPTCLAVSPENTPIPNWLAFLDSLKMSADSIATLQEMMGYLLSRDTWAQRVLCLQGAPRSGKGTIGNLITKMVGAANFVASDPRSLAENFGLEGWVGRSVAWMADVDDWGGDRMKVVASRVKTVTSNDAVIVARKNKTQMNVRLGTRILIACNSLPRLSDTSAATASRFVVAHFGESYLGREDHGLGKRLESEMNGIAWWALDGLARLRERGAFTTSEEGRDVVKQVAQLAAPIDSWFEECCTKDANASTSRNDLYRSFKVWCDDNGNKCPSSNAFYAMLRERKFAERMIHGGVRVFAGLRIGNTVGDAVETPF